MTASSGLLDAGGEVWTKRMLRASMFGVTAWWSVKPDRVEHARRGGVPYGMLERLNVLDVLMGLPVGLPVPLSELTMRECRVLEGLPDGLVDVGGRDVIRRVCSPLQVQHVVVAARSFRTGIDAASTFATYCPRTVVLGGTDRPGDDALAEAAFFGVGVMLGVGGMLTELVGAEPLVGAIETPAGWALEERLYRQMPAAG